MNRKATGGTSLPRSFGRLHFVRDSCDLDLEFSKTVGQLVEAPGRRVDPNAAETLQGSFNLSQRLKLGLCFPLLFVQFASDIHEIRCRTPSGFDIGKDIGKFGTGNVEVHRFYIRQLRQDVIRIVRGHRHVYWFVEPVA